MLNKVLEWLFAAILVIVLLPCIVSIVVHTLGPVLLTALEWRWMFTRRQLLERGRKQRKNWKTPSLRLNGVEWSGRSCWIFPSY